MELAAIGATEGGGVDRQAFSEEDRLARRLVHLWATELGARPEVDAIGNLFFRYPGTDEQLPSVLTGSHLDTQPTGGKFDGAFGVMAGLEALEALRASGISAERSIDLVIWANEEGCRFHPSTMGSAVRAGEISLETALRTRDESGGSVREYLDLAMRDFDGVSRRSFETHYHAYLEAHIEQGPVLERSHATIGAVTGIQGLRQFEVEIRGCEAHAGTTPRAARRDALIGASEFIAAFSAETRDPEDSIRFTVGAFDVYPGALNTIPGRVTFTIDLRHPDEATLDELERRLNVRISSMSPCDAEIRRIIQSPYTAFDAALINEIVLTSERLGYDVRKLISGATHDARFMAASCPTAMIFIPCKEGVSHNAEESASAEHVASGTRVLADVIGNLCGFSN
ncbi:MAG: M20 family metallo-hydrolase [Deltaproteobacteria bacterium]|nr:M20 family metallo-hydrolase [Deltaproteobacteria bacterium]